MKASEQVKTVSTANMFEPQRTMRFVLRVMNARGDLLIPAYLIKNVKFSPCRKKIWFQMNVSEACPLQSYIDITSLKAGVTAEIELLTFAGAVTNMVTLHGLKLELEPIELDYSDGSPLVLTFRSR